MKGKHYSSRLYLVLAVIVLALGAIGWRLFDIGLRRHDWYAQAAASQADGSASMLVRGNISMSDGRGQLFTVATNRRFGTAMINASKVDATGIDSLAGQLADITGIDRIQLAEALRRAGGSNRVVARRLTDQQVGRIKALKAPGVTTGYEVDRAYPAGSLGADVIGFLGYNQAGRSGQYGVESAYERELTGADALGTGFDLLGSIGSLFGREPKEPDTTTVRTRDVELTIDKNVQAYAEQKLREAIDRYDAASGTIVIQEPMTGRILAIADSPSFDPNVYGSHPINSFLNGALVPFEPGSSFKPVTMAIGLESGKVTPQTTFNDSGDMVIDGYTIKNFNEQHFGVVTMSKILEKSLNTGMMHVETLVGNDAFLRFIVDMGFGQKTGVDLPGETAGSIDNLYTGRRINFLTASFGQGITVTPLQLANAYSAIANGGKVMRPYVVAAVTDDNGQRTATQPEVAGTPISAKTAAQLKGMLVSVVDNGFDKARIPHYDVAGKTGTAQIASPTGGYLEGEYNHSFAGFAPASNPRFTIVIKIEKPQGVTFAADSLSPVFKDIALYLLNYFSVPPTR